MNLDWRHVFRALLLGLIAIASGEAAWARCSDTRIQRLAEQGRTVAQIATTCDMEKDDVVEVLDQVTDPPQNGRPGSGGSRRQPEGGGFASGQPASGCGCWGAAMPGMQLSHPACRSGVAIAVACPMGCSGGGSAWRGVCQ